ncbi:GNAT family N-acetyltransferase [Clostridium sp.]|uniref:GNAT family N-acetyltransferase n=1 Tax=Clostridium sp. TaxID=1506 RepID=UPI002FC5B924
MKIKLKRVCKENYKEILDLHVGKGQEGFIETTEECLNEAKELSLWRPVGIYNDDILVGFAMYGLFKEEGEFGRVWLDRFMIGCDYQGKGYGRASLKVLISELYDEYNYNEIYLSIYDDNKNAIKLYEDTGFYFNGELDINGEKVMVKKIR